MTPTAIEWTDVVWNPTTGCDRVSPGCDHCYALTMAKRLKGMGSAKYQRDGDPKTSGPGFGITEHATALAAPLSWRKPRKVFVNSMSDLFHKGVSDEFVARVWAVMAATPQHTYQVLTKRHGRMRSLVSSHTFRRLVADALYRPGEVFPGGLVDWPLPNVWLGVSVEDQKRADLRIHALLDTPAAVRFLSCEPLLGPVDLIGEADMGCDEAGPAITHSGVSYRTDYGTGVEFDCDHQVGIDWVIVGGESGTGARPMHEDWAKQLRDQCVATDVAFLFKQWGDWRPLTGNECAMSGDEWPAGTRGGMSRRVGKHDAGRILDGRTWDEFPKAGAV